jgi:hypothetical protein
LAKGDGIAVGSLHRVSFSLVSIPLFVIASGCRGGSTTGENAPTTSKAHSGVRQQIDVELSEVINTMTKRHLPLEWEYDEDLLEMVDQIEARARGEAKGEKHRFLRRVTEQEEMEHYKETIRRWEEQQGRSLRSAIDPLIAEVAARKPGGPRYYPEFHARCRLVLDDFIKFDVLEMQERRNKAIHEKATPVLAKYRAEHPDVVHEYELTLDKQYPLPRTEARSKAQHPSETRS